MISLRFLTYLINQDFLLFLNGYEKGLIVIDLVKIPYFLKVLYCYAISLDLLDFLHLLLKVSIQVIYYQV